MCLILPSFFSLLCGTLYNINIKGGKNMPKNGTKMYAPHERDFYHRESSDIRTYSEEDSTDLPDPVTDPIVAMNISNMEFDYTYYGGEELFDEDFDEEE
jgi:hypothetical protein